MITLGCFVPVPEDATSWYRAYGPLRYCREGVELIALNYQQEKGWSSLTRCDMIFLQRPAVELEVYAPLLLEAKSLNIPIWADWDDDLTCVPPWNPWHLMFMKERNLMTIDVVKRHADFVTVSTEALAKSLGKGIVIPNAWEPGLVLPKVQRNPEAPPHIMWRGGKSHGYDLQMSMPFWLELPENWRVTFLGHSPDFTYYCGKNVEIMAEPMAVTAFLRKMAEMAPDIVVVPLIDNQFNRAKSDIAFLEATQCGAITIAPRWAPWTDNQGILTYDPKKDFAAQVREMVDYYVYNPTERMALLEKAQTYVKENRLANGIVKQQRMSIIETARQWRA